MIDFPHCDNCLSRKMCSADGCIQGRAVAIELIMNCPQCSARHIDKGAFATKAHHTHACQNCGFVWRPAVQDTVGVQFLAGFKDA